MVIGERRCKVEALLVKRDDQFRRIGLFGHGAHRHAERRGHEVASDLVERSKLRSERPPSADEGGDAISTSSCGPAMAKCRRGSTRMRVYTMEKITGGVSLDSVPLTKGARGSWTEAGYACLDPRARLVLGRDSSAKAQSHGV